jgi:hypothetical protein
MHQRLQNQTRPFAGRGGTFSKWQWAANAGLITAAFVFVGAVTLGLFP